MKILKPVLLQFTRMNSQSHMGKAHAPLQKTWMNLYWKETGKSVKLCYNTLIHGANGMRSFAEANALKSWLTEEETALIITYIGELGNWGFPLSHHGLKEHVDKILQTHLGNQFLRLEVSKNRLSTLLRSIPRISKCPGQLHLGQNKAGQSTPTPWKHALHC